MGINTDNFNLPDWNQDDFGFGDTYDNSYDNTTITPANNVVNNQVVTDSQSKADSTQGINGVGSLYAPLAAESPTLEAPITPLDVATAPGLDDKVITGKMLKDIQTKMSDTYNSFLNGPDRQLSTVISGTLLNQFPNPSDFNKAQAAFLIPDMVDGNSQIAQATKKTIESMTAQFSAALNSDTPITPNPNQGEMSKVYLAFSAGNNFEKLIKDMKGLSKKEEKQLIHAYSHPEDLAKLSPKLQKAFQQAFDLTMDGLSLKYGLSESAQISNQNMKTAVVDMKMREDYNKGFEKMVKEYAKENGLSPQDASTLISMHYHPEANFGGGESLRGIYETLDDQLTTSLVEKYGLPDGGTISPDTLTFDYQNTGKFFVNLEKELKAVSPPLKHSQIDQMMDVAMKRGKEPLSPELNDILTAAQASALQTAQGNIGMPSWNPVITQANPLIDNTQALKILKGGIRSLEEGLETAKNLNTNNPFTGSNRIEYKSFLMTISSMLDLLKQNIFEMLANDASVSKLLSLGQTDTKMNELQKQREQIEEQRKQLEKQESMGFLGPLMDVIIAIMCVILLGPWLGAVVAAILITLMETHGLDKLFAFIEKIITKMGEAMGFPDELIQAMVIIAKITVALMIVAIAMVANPLIGLMVFFMVLSSSKIIQDIAEACGASKETANWIAMGIQIALAVLVIVLMFIVPEIIPELIASMMPAILAEAMQTAANAMQTVATAVETAVTTLTETLTTTLQSLGTIGEVLASVIQTVVQLAQTLGVSMDSLMVLLEITESIINIATGIQGLVTHLNLAEIQKEIGSLEQMTKVLQGNYKVMGSVKSSMQSAMTMDVSWAADVGQMQSQMWQDLSNSLTGLFSA